MHILIFESAPGEIIERTGQSHALNFGTELQQIDPLIDIGIAAPYDQPFDKSLLSTTDAAVFPCAGVSWSTHDAEAAPLREAMEAVFECGLPCFGSCNGLHLAGVILGGRVETKSPELGIAREITLTEAGLTHPMMVGRLSKYSAPTVHSDQVVELPNGAQLLATNSHCPIQSFAYNSDGINFWGVQYHPEISAGNIAKYIQENNNKYPNSQNLIRDLLIAETNPQAATRLGTSIGEMSRRVRTTELRNWLSYIAVSVT